MKDPEKQELVPTRLPPAITIRRGFIGEITIHQITEEELETLARGYPESVYLNYAIFLLSVATSFLVSLITTVVSNRVFTVFCHHNRLWVYFRNIAFDFVVQESPIHFSAREKD